MIENVVNSIQEVTKYHNGHTHPHASGFVVLLQNYLTMNPSNELQKKCGRHAQNIFHF